MRLTGFEALDDMRAAAPRLREAVVPRLAAAFARASEATAPWLERGRARLAPGRTWLAGQIAKSTALAAALAAITGTWATIVEAFCATIDPYLSRWFPDLRLVASVGPSGALELTRTLKNEATFLGPSDAIDADARAALSAARFTAVELRLRPDQVLRRSLSLPAASREFLASIVEHKLERLTPWRPERVLYGTRILDEGDGGTLTVELLATSKDIVAVPLQALGALGLVPTAIGIEDGPRDDPAARQPAARRAEGRAGRLAPHGLARRARELRDLRHGLARNLPVGVVRG